MADTRICQISAFLNQIYGENINKKFDLKGSQVLIGRSPQANIRLECPSVSRKHCIMTYTDKGWEIKDNKSQNGTWVCGQRLQPNQSRLLQCGDIVFLGPPSELPQAFCYEIKYDCETSTEAPLNSVIERNEKIVLDNTPKDTLVKTPEKCNLLKTSNGEIFVISPEKNSINILNNPDLLTQTSSTDCSYKRKLPISTHSWIPSSSSNEQKKIKCLESSLNDFNISTSHNCHESNSTDQVNEISSTENNQMEDSESLLDKKDKEMPHHSSQSKEESENAILQSKLNLMAAELEKLKNERLIFARKFKKNDTKKQSDEQKLKGELQKCEEKAKNEIKKEIMEKFEEDLMCNICTELLIKPTVLECSHTFCEYCIHEWKKKKNECPMCRKKIETLTRVLTLDNLIDKTLETLTPDQKVKREELIKERIMAEQQKKVKKSPVYQSNRHRRTRRRASSRNSTRPAIEVSPRRNLLFPIQLPPITYPLYLNDNFRVPEVLLSDEEIDTINIYVS